VVKVQKLGAQELCGLGAPITKLGTMLQDRGPELNFSTL